MPLTRREAESHELFEAGIARGIFVVDGERIRYQLAHQYSQDWGDPEEWVRALSIARLVVEKGYPPNRIKIELTVPRRTPSDLADIVVHDDDRCRSPYLVVECKRDGIADRAQAQAIEQLFGNCNSLRAPLGLYDSWSSSSFYDVANFPPTERVRNRIGDESSLPPQYGLAPQYQFVAGDVARAIRPAQIRPLENKIRRAHSMIWAGGKRDPLTAFDEWSKLLFAKVEDERSTPNGSPMSFQVGTNETTATVASRVHDLFRSATRNDPTVFPSGARISLTDKKIYDVVGVLQDVSITDTSTDTIGRAFESFFGSVFRGELGQYFTMRQLARFTVASLEIERSHFVIDPTAGSGGFLLEVLLQAWHGIDIEFAGRREIDRIKNDFALHKVYGIEIHQTLARICKINLLLHHDGHTNIEADKSCLDSEFELPRLNPPEAKFDRVVGNPPFGDDVSDGDEDVLGSSELSSFEVASGRSGAPSEHVILERSIRLLKPGGRLGMILPDGLFNNQSESSNCPRVRRYLAMTGRIEGIVSLPDHAFRKSGAQNKTSILFFRKFTRPERIRFEDARVRALEAGHDEDAAIGFGLRDLDYLVFLAEALQVGYTATGAVSPINDLYVSGDHGGIAENQSGTILGEFRRFKESPSGYDGSRSPDCMALTAGELWAAHPSHRLDPKYFLFKRDERGAVPEGWVKLPITSLMRRRVDEASPESQPEEIVKVMTVSQTGEIRSRQAGKGRAPPEWLGAYFEDMPATWFAAREGDVVFSSIDLWKGCIAVVPAEFDGALVTKEFPIYEVIDRRLDPRFLSCLLRSRYYQRAFRAITTGHSNRRRTQVPDFEGLEICFPVSHEVQMSLIAPILNGQESRRSADSSIRAGYFGLSDMIDGRGDQELPELEIDDSPEVD
jgi:type I restriction enzyme M protein